MATIVFSAIGGALGSSVLSGILGATTGALLGRAGGALLGNFVDEAIFGRGNEASSSLSNRARLADELKVTTAYHGAPIAEPFGRTRLGGHLIWADEVRVVEAGDTVQHLVNFAVAFCEGEVHRIGRFWINDQIAMLHRFDHQLYRGTEYQPIDPLMQAAVGEGRCPNYAAIAYVVFENFDIAPFGDRIPNLEFEVFRHAPKQAIPEMREQIQAVNIIPGSGEFVYSTRLIQENIGPGEDKIINANLREDVSDLSVSVSQMQADLPNLGAASLVVSWFGNDLRCGECSITPRVEIAQKSTTPEWFGGGVDRASAQTVSAIEGKPSYGGTPDDQSVIDAISELRDAGLEVTFYPFILMDIPADNGRADPYWGGENQPINPWRGRITTSLAPNSEGSPDRTAQARNEVEAFLGGVVPTDFRIEDGRIYFDGNPNDWGYRRYILHHAMLCQLAGGVDRFLIGSELRGLTQIRDEADRFPFVEALRGLASEVRAILPTSKISYAADWSEFRGYAPSNDAGAFYFHLDLLWSDENIDFIGVDNYTPVSDWRHGSDHLDAHFGHQYALDYLRGNVSGGEGYDWYYASHADRINQVRTLITDGEGEPWIWRYKDIRSWWENPHFDRPSGVRTTTPTQWVERSKPIVFCEYGAGAIDLAGNQPNKFLDPNSDESAAPHFSRGEPDELAQVQYVAAVNAYWSDEGNNPISNQYAGRMVDIERAHYWCWDARPWPAFPARDDLWSDGANYYTGHWINGRVNNVQLANVVASICDAAGLDNYDVSRLYGLVPSLIFDGRETAAQKLESLMASYAFRTFWRNETLCFVSSIADHELVVDLDGAVALDDGGIIETTTERAIDLPDLIELQYLDLSSAFETQKLVYRAPDGQTQRRIGLDLNMALDHGYAQLLAKRLLHQARLGRERIKFRRPPMDCGVSVGDRIKFEGNKSDKSYVVDAVNFGRFAEIEAYLHAREDVLPNSAGTLSASTARAVNSNLPWVEALDLGLTTRAELNIIGTAKPWNGQLIYTSDGERLGVRSVPHAMGRMTSSLSKGLPDRRQNQSFEIELTNGQMDQTVIKGFDKPMFALTGAGGIEIIGFDNAELIGTRSYRISGLYRGLRDSVIGEHDVHTRIVALTPRMLTINADFLADGQAQDLRFQFSGSERFGELMLDPPFAGSSPMSPAVKTSADGLTIIARSRGDHDYMRDAGANFGNVTETYHIVFEFSDGSTEVIETTDHQVSFSERPKSISIHAENSAGYQSQTRKEILS